MGKRSLQIKVGLLIVTAAVILGGFIFILGNYSFGKGFTIEVDFDFVGNLTPGAPVKIAGIKMGRVESIKFMGGTIDSRTKRRVFVRVTLWIKSSGKNAVRSDSRVFINTQGILGEQYVEIEPGNMDSPKSLLLTGDSAPLKGETPPRSDLVVARLYTFLDEITSLMVSEKETIRTTLRRSSSTLGLVTDILKENREEIRQTLKKGNKLMGEVTVSAERVNQIIGDGKKISRAINFVDYLLSYLTGRLPKLFSGIEETLAQVNNVTKLAGPKERDKIMASLSRFDSLSIKLEGLTYDARKMLGSISKGKGSIGALITRREVYEDLKELVRDLRENPWKLFWKD
ncbi:MCE family protein [Myxococcota bacterium]|nr:MCE family protein [Myxococcota bacterium]MBU1535070.1 MCE family protein [Myxococcota bacterium]